MKIGRHAARTDTGRRRLGNEDAYVVEPPLFVIADGMGGARAGEIAAGLAATVFEDAGGEIRDSSDLRSIIEDANRRIWERSLVDPATAGMGTTITVALVDEAAGGVTFGHVGDSRAYRVRDGEIEQVTTDHSLVAELVQSGVLTPEEAERHPQRSAITRALGTESVVEADIFTVEAEDGDLFLLCSDGLSDMLSDGEMADAIASAGYEPQRAAEALVRAANARGGEDNVTVILFEMTGARTDFERQPLASTPVDGTEGPDTAELLVPVAPGDDETGEELEGDDGDDAGRPRRFGAGPGGRAAALLLLASILGLGIAALYVALSR